MKEGAPLSPPDNILTCTILKIGRTASLALILKMYHANSGVNRMYSQGRKLTTVKHKCYAKITMQYILKVKNFNQSEVRIQADSSKLSC